MYTKANIGLIAVFFLAVNFISAQFNKESLSFQHIKQGMSQNSTTVLYEDSYGFIWAGTENGINKFDGTNFKIFEKGLNGNNGLHNGYINDIREINNTFYIGTAEGLNIYDRTVGVIKPYPFKNEKSKIASKSIQTIEQTDNFLWLGTYYDGLFRYHVETGEVEQFLVDESLTVGSNNNHILKVIEVYKNRLLVVSEKAIFLIDENMQVLNKISEEEKITNVTQITKNNFLLGTKSGTLLEIRVDKISVQKVKRKVISPGFLIMSIAKDIQNRIWIGTENNGLFIYSSTLEQIHHLTHDLSRSDGISVNSIWSLMPAKNGVMWIGTFKNGLSFYDSKYHKFEHIQANPFTKNSINNNIINCFEEDSHSNLWIGTDGGGLNYWNRTSNTFQHFSLDKGNFESNVVLSLLQIDKNTLLVGTWSNGLIIFDTKTKKYKVWNTKNSFLTSNHIYALHKDKKERLWIVNHNGDIQLYDFKTKTHQNIIINSDVDGAKITTFKRLFEDLEGNFWLGSTTSGLFRLTENNNKWNISHYYNGIDSKKISNNYVNSIVQDSTGNIWAGTEGGLNRYCYESDSFEAITKNEGLKNDAIKGIISDKNGLLWLSTGKGLLHYNPKTKNSLEYDIDDGLQANEFNVNSYYKTKNSEFLFGGSDGFNIFNANEIKKRNNIPPVYIARLKIFNEPIIPNDESGILKKAISQTDSLTLSHTHSVVNFEFQTISFRHADRVEYAYFLEGFETEWNYVNNISQATYTNLNPGKYKLRIKSTNSDGIWNNQETKLVITVTPPYWQTWWFRFLAIFIIIASTYLFYYLRVRQIKKYQVNLEHEINERTHELRLEQKKLIATADKLSIKNEEIQRFTYALSHDLKSPITNVEMLVEFISEDLKTNKHAQLNQYLNYITEACKTLQNLIADITQIAKLGKIENKKEVVDTKLIIQKAVDLIISRFKEKNVQLIVAPNLPIIIADQNRFIQVFENLIDNAIKYMGNQKKPVVHIDWFINKEILIFQIKDNGSGMDRNALSNLFTPFKRFDSNTDGTGLGLYMIKKIIESHKGTIIAHSEGKGKGAIFELCFPQSICQQKVLETK